LFFSACHKKQQPIEPPEEPSSPPAEQQPAPPSGKPAPAPKPRLEAPPPRPRAPSPGDKASLQLVESGMKQMNNGQLDDAEQMFEQALRVSPTNGRPYYYLGVIATKQKEYDRALGFLSQAEVHLHDDSFWMSQVLMQEGSVYKALNQKDNARRKFEEALKRDPDNKWAAAELKSLQK
jgi:tetratricopeptide (TPR) repeat protein